MVRARFPWPGRAPQVHHAHQNTSRGSADLRHCKDRIQMSSGWWFGTFFIFPYIGNNHPNWLIFSEGFKPPTSRVCSLFFLLPSLTASSWIFACSHCCCRRLSFISKCHRHPGTTTRTGCLEQQLFRCVESPGEKTWVSPRIKDLNHGSWAVLGETWWKMCVFALVGGSCHRGILGESRWLMLTLDSQVSQNKHLKSTDPSRTPGEHQAWVERAISDLTWSWSQPPTSKVSSY